MQKKNTKKAYPLHPGWLVLITIIAGLTVSGPVAGASLFKCGYRKLGWIAGMLLCLLGLFFHIFAILWSVEWYWATLMLTGAHILCGSALFFILWIPYRNFRKIFPTPKKERGSYQKVIAGMIGGAFINGLLGIVCTIIFIILIDRIFSTLMPVDFEDIFTGVRFFIIVLFLMLAGTIAGGFLGRIKPRITTGQMIIYGLVLVVAYFTWLMALEITTSIPGFQAGAATGKGWTSLITPFFLGNILIGFWWPVFLLFFIVSPPGKLGKMGRVAQVVGINLAAGITFSITFGYSADMFLASGRYFERGAFTGKALWCYEQGLRKEPEDWTASYLQYRAALLNHKLGNTNKAKRGFRRVVSKYTQNKELVKKANRFLDSLDRSTEKKRVVLAGVETRTEYKGGYCVPNSLALAMRYWGSNITARGIGERITGLGSGTFIVNQAWFAEREGFRHDFLPMAGLDDIKQCIDAGFPVLVYVPAHIFAIVGYDEALETFVTYDVATNDIWVEYIQKDFIKSWKRQATTLVLAYPPEKENKIPKNILSRLIRLSDNYLHFQLHFFDAPGRSISIPHLFKAAGNTGEFFFPITILYSDFPGLRKTISEKYDENFVIDSIKSYFWDDFDEGLHSAGQYHNQRWARPDWALMFSIKFLIGHKRFDLAEELISRIDEEGQVNKNMMADIGLINLSRGKLKDGLDRLVLAKETKRPLYAGLSYLKMDDKQGAIRELVKTIKGFTWKTSKGSGYSCSKEYNKRSSRKNRYFTDSKRKLCLDNYGFPEIAVANQILIHMDSYGKSRENLERKWEKWIHHIPFDAPVANALAKLLKQRLVKLDKKKKPAAFQRLERKFKLVQSRATRYDINSFAQ